MLSCRPVLLLAFVLLTCHSALLSQQITKDALKPNVGSNWERVKVLPVATTLHVKTDHGNKSCRVFAVTDEALTCAKHSNKAGTVLQRTEIRQIKLTRYVRSTLIGAGVGGGIGAIAGAAALKNEPCPPAQGFCLNDVGPGAGGGAAIAGVAGALLGGVVSGGPDLARGSAIYTRP